ncbi:COPI associated protein-domain-containing protein [Pilobolus umbonatus]|nr:COPI associated protein-domain-containing protein [Pilobolus umbonatus]
MVSRTKIENFICLALNGTNIILYSFIIVAMVFQCIHGDFSVMVINIYAIIISCLLIINEIQETNLSTVYFYFLSSFRGRGLMLIFFGCLVLDTDILNIVAGTLSLAIGLMYIIMSFLSNFPRPHSITLNWRKWNEFSLDMRDLSYSNQYHHRHTGPTHGRLNSPTTIIPDLIFTKQVDKNSINQLENMFFPEKPYTHKYITI